MRGKWPCTLCRSATLRLSGARLLRRGVPASPETFCLRLLPSGPDLVHSASPRGTRPSTPRGDVSPTGPDLEREFNPAKAGCGYRAPLAPRLARPAESLAPNGDPSFRWKWVVGGPLDRLRTRVGHLGELAQPSQHAHIQVVVHLDLARQSHGRCQVFDACKSSCLRFGHRARITGDNVNATSCAARIAAAAVQDVDTGILDG